MGFYNPDPKIQRTEQELRDSRSALRWIALATIFMIISAISQIVWFVFLVKENPNTLAAFIVMVGSFVLGRYCKWCSDDVKPEGWKK